VYKENHELYQIVASREVNYHFFKDPEVGMCFVISHQTLIEEFEKILALQFDDSAYFSKKDIAEMFIDYLGTMESYEFFHKIIKRLNEKRSSNDNHLE